MQRGVTAARRRSIASELTASAIGLEVMDQDDWVAAQVASGQQECMARFVLGIFQAAETGFFAGVDPLLGKLLGHEPRTVRAFSRSGLPPRFQVNTSTPDGLCMVHNGTE